MSNQDYSDVTFSHAMNIYNFHMDQISRARHDSTPFTLSFWGGVEMSIVPVENEDQVNTILIGLQKEVTPVGIEKWKYYHAASVEYALGVYSDMCRNILEEIAQSNT